LEDGEFLIVNKLVYSEVDLEKLSNVLPFVEPGDSPKRNVFHGRNAATSSCSRIPA